VVGGREMRLDFKTAWLQCMIENCLYYKELIKD
jgi:hypothetical protein